MKNIVKNLKRAALLTLAGILVIVSVGCGAS